MSRVQVLVEVIPAVTLVGGVVLVVVLREEIAVMVDAQVMAVVEVVVETSVIFHVIQ